MAKINFPGRPKGKATIYSPPAGPAPQKLPIPANFSVSNITQTNFAFTMDSVAGAMGYEVQYRRANTSNAFQTGYSAAQPYGVVNSLASATTFEVQRRALHSDPAYHSDWSASVPVTTQALVTLTSIAVSGPNSVNEGTVTSYTATGTYSDGSTQNLNSTATWNASEGSIMNGMLTIGSNSTTGDNRTVTISATLNGVSSPAKTISVTDTTPPPPPSGERVTGQVPYNIEWAYQLDTSDNNFGPMFDGQNARMDGAPTSYNMKNMLEVTPTEFTFPASMNYEGSYLTLFDGEGTSSVIYIDVVRTDGQRLRLTSTEGTHYNGSKYLGTWTFNIPAEWKNIAKFVFENREGANWPWEIAFYGTYTPYVAPAPAPVVRRKFKEVNGTNAFPWDMGGHYPDGDINVTTKRIPRFDGMRWVRAYDDWYLFEAVKDDYRYNPTHSGSWNIDRGFERIKAKGTNIIQCIKTIPQWMEMTYPYGDGHRHGENAYHKYKGNLAFFNYQGAFPANGTTSTLSYQDWDGSTKTMFPFTGSQPTVFVAKDTQLCYDWNGSSYVLKTTNAGDVYFDVYTSANATSTNPIGKLRTVFNAKFDADRKNPASYLEFGQMAFQSAARFGANTTVSDALVLTPDKKKGLNLVVGIEAGNELNAFWHGRKRWMAPDEQAALLSAFYDGHKGTLGTRCGVKTADPNLDAYVGGTVSVSLPYYRVMIEWCRLNRGYLPDGTVNLCWDVAKYHQYTSSAGITQHQGATFGMPADMVPIALEAVQKLNNLHKELAGKTIRRHIGETGYDKGPSPQSVPHIRLRSPFYVGVTVSSGVLSWSRQSDASIGGMYDIYRRPRGEHWQPWTFMKQVADTVTSYTPTGTEVPNGVANYDYETRAPFVISGSVIRWQRQDPTNNSRYYIFRRPASSTNNNDWKLVGSVADTVNSYTVADGLMSGYTYDVRAHYTKNTWSIRNTTTGQTLTRGQVHGAWLIRDMMMYCNAGIDSMQSYLLEDPVWYDYPWSLDMLYASSGDFAKPVGDIPDETSPAAWYKRQFSGAFGEYTPTQMVSQGPNILKAENAGQVMYACWSPTMNGSVVSYTLALPGVSSVTRHTFQDGSYNFLTETLNVTNGQLPLTLTEVPFFIKVN